MYTARVLRWILPVLVSAACLPLGDLDSYTEGPRPEPSEDAPAFETPLPVAPLMVEGVPPPAPPPSNEGSQPVALVESPSPARTRSQGARDASLPPPEALVDAGSPEVEELQPPECEGLLGPSWSCYTLHSLARDWETARDVCLAEGSHLATVETAEEDAFLAPSFPNDMWIGARNDNLGVTRWVTGAVVTGFENWGPGQPDGFPGDCVEKRQPPGGLWHDQPCGISKPYVCEREP